MKGKLIVLTVTVLTAIVAFSSCKIRTKPTNNVESLVISRGDRVTIVTGSDYNEEAVVRLADAIFEITGVLPEYKNETSAKGDREIVVGETSLEITAEAERRLAKSVKRAVMDSEDEKYAAEDLAGYAVYSASGSIAIVWSSEYFGELAVDYFTENYLSQKSLTLEDGYIKTNVVSKQSFLNDRGEKIKAEKWAELGAKLPDEYSEEIVAALKSFYSLLTPDMVRWLANLYDPSVGGFYFSNSARDNYGFLPDIESTYGVLTFIDQLGMAEMYGGDWVAALPEWLKAQIGDWVYSLQNPDGFYYHPQWPKEYIVENGLQTRITRDVGSANTILKAFGITPKYGTEISGASISVPLCALSSTAVAVAKVLPVSGMMSQFANTENFIKYLEELEAELVPLDADGRAYRFYAWGNEFQSSHFYMNSEMKKLLVEFFDKYQNQETGVWCENLSWNATNGLHKIAYVYNCIGGELKYTDKMIDTTLKILTESPESRHATSAVHVTNAVSCFSYIYTNVRKHGSGNVTENNKTVERYKGLVFENAGTMIRNAVVHASGFGYPDGSFGTSLPTEGNGGVAQGCPVAIKGAKEGDVNGNFLSTVDVIRDFMEAFELSDYMVPIFTEAERYLFVSILEELSGVVKYEEEIVDLSVYDFESQESEERFFSEVKMLQNNAEVCITEKNGNKRLFIKSTNWYGLEGMNTTKRNANFTVYPHLIANGANASVLEFDIAFKGVRNPSTGAFSIHFMSNASGTFSTFPIKLYKDGKNFYIGLLDHDGKDLGIKLPVGDVTMKLRFEYYHVEERFKIYVNGKYLTETSAMKSAETLHSVNFEFQGSAEMTALFDNMTFHRDKIKYELLPNGSPPTFPTPESGRHVYDFEDSVGANDYPDQISIATNGGAVNIGEIGGKYLSISGSSVPQNKNPQISLGSFIVDSDGNAYVYSSDMQINYSAPKDVFTNAVRLQFCNEYGNEVFAIKIRAKRVGNKTILGIADKSRQTQILTTFMSGQSINLKLVYFPTECEIFIYIDGVLVAIDENSMARTDIETVNIIVESGAGVDMRLDNIGFNRQKVDYESGEPPVVPDFGDIASPFPWFDSDDALPDGEIDSGNIDNGGFTPVLKPGWVSGDTSEDCGSSDMDGESWVPLT